MAGISAKDVKALRDQTGAGMMDCKRALADASGDTEKALELLRERGLAKAGTRAGRATSEGSVGMFLAGPSAGLVELGCETDFVARTNDFKQLEHDIAMQGAAMDPSYIDASDAPTDGESVSETCLLQQPFIKDPAKTIQDLILSLIHI